MHKGFTKATLSLLGAALLSSSAFAVGPTIDGIPNVVITDFTKSPGAVPDPGTSATPATNVYRYTDAFSLATYVTYDPDSNAGTDDLPAVRWLFNERDPNSLGIRTGGDKTISIDNTLGEDTAPDFATITGSGNTINTGIGGDLDFVNVALSPDLGLDGSAPSGAGGIDEAVIDLYVAAIGDSGSNVDSDTFSVFTAEVAGTNPFDGDQLTEPTGIYTPELCLEEFENWFQFSTQGAGVAAGTFTPDAGSLPNTLVSDFDPVLGSSPATGTGQDTLRSDTLATPAGASGSNAFQFTSWSSLRRDYLSGATLAAVPVAADDTLIMARWKVSADAATQAAASGNRLVTSSEIPTLRLALGENSQFGNGKAFDLYVNNSANSITEQDRIVRTYYHAKRGGNYVTNDFDANAATPSNPAVVVGAYIDILDLFSGSASGLIEHPNGHRDFGFILESLELFSTTPDQLSNANVEFNVGGPVVSGDSTTAPAGNVQFDTAVWDGRLSVETGSTRLTLVPVDEGNGGPTAATDTVGFQIASSTTQGFGAIWDTNDYNLGGGGVNPNEIVEVTNDQLVRIDAWLSTTASASTPAPGVSDPLAGSTSFARVGYFAELFGGTADISDPFFSQGRTGYLDFAMGQTPNLDVFFEMEGVYGLGSAPIRVSYFFEPNLVGGPSTVLSLRPYVAVYGFTGSSASDVDNIAGTITLNRIVVTTYDIPADPVCN